MENTDQEKGFCSVDISVYLHEIVFIVLTTNSLKELCKLQHIANFLQNLCITEFARHNA